MNQPATVEDLQAVLRTHGISSAGWGTGPAKTVEYLLEEILLGETRLVRTAGGRLLREIAVVCLEITRGEFVLEELYQLFYESGRKRRRKLDSSTGEKLKPGETPEEGIQRLIRTEFPVLLLQPPEDVRKGGIQLRESESESYPGLMTRYQLHHYSVELTIDLPPITVQESDKLSAYHWVPRV